MVKKILISGASGFVGGILVEHLSKNPNYDVYVMDKHIALSPRYQLENRSISEEQRPILPLKEKFYVCDITDKNQLSRIIQDNQINNECDLIYTDRLMNLQSKLMIKMMIHFRVFVLKNLQQHTRI
jgi:nucleoside-diphosphate-sugar epimerase